jgi:hypothetical protein
MNVKISDEEWKEICYALLDHHSLFYKVGEMGKPYLSDSIDTACVTFDKSGNFINFLFNPEFWKTSSTYKKIFVICHESLHLILQHGKRFKDTKNNLKANYAMDVVVNHTLVNRFGFIREEISDWEELCWVDTIFKNKKVNNFDIPTDETAEYYLNLLNRIYPEDYNGNGSRLLDSHDFLDGEETEFFKKLNEGLTQEEKESLKKFYDKHAPKSQAGTSAGTGLHIAAKEKQSVKRKWETAVTTWSQKMMRSVSKEQDQWARKHRRFMFLETSFFLPTEFEVEDFDIEKGRLKVLFFLDTSGSCWHLKDRFFNAAESLPVKYFDVELLCFDTQVTPTTVMSRKIHGGGGTSFNIIDTYIKQNHKQHQPDAVWIMTDGYGDAVSPENPQNWFWFLTPHSSKEFIPPASKIYDLNDFV